MDPLIETLLRETRINELLRELCVAVEQGDRDQVWELATKIRHLERGAPDE